MVRPWLESLRAAQPRLVWVSVTPFGLSGPRAGWRGNDLIAFHSSGFAYAFPALQVDHAGLPPLNGPTYAAEFLAGQVAASAALHGLLGAQRTGRGSHLDVSLQEAVAAANNSQFNRVQGGSGSNSRRVFSDRPSNSIVALLPCADGWVAISPREEHQWARWLEVMDGPAWASDPRFADRAARERHWAALYPLLAEWSRQRTKAAVFAAAQAHRVACLPLGTASDLLGSAQLAARAFFVELDDATLGGHVVVPGRPYHLEVGEAAASEPAEAAASAGRTTEATVAADQPAEAAVAAGETAEAALAAAGTGEAADQAAEAAVAAARQSAGAAQVVAAAEVSSLVRPLAGVRVVDFSWVLTGPICTKLLAALGAEVIKVESAARADLSQRSLAWEELNPSKRSITLNLRHERARELARALIARSDVVVENFSTGVMERLGLDYGRLRQLNPRLIMASSSAFGRQGPDREQVAYGTLVQCLTGWAALSAHPGYPPRSAGSVWTDPLTASFETVLVLAAIWRQRQTGAGVYIDLSMAETTIAALPEPILAWCLRHEELGPRGNRHPLYAPQGCYPALGDDAWVALSVQSDAEWMTLARLLERADLLADAELATAAGRRAQHDRLDAAIAAWTASRSASETAACLQAHGIAATPTLPTAEVVHDAHLGARGFFQSVPRLDGRGTFVTLGAPWLIDGQRPSTPEAAPSLGRDNAYVFRDLLGLDAGEYERLRGEQVIF
jgi:benzylsuccinate CoA-transferase BbsF subunit